MSFSTEIWNPALNLKKPTSNYSHESPSMIQSPPASNSSSHNPQLPPKRNLLYRIFHPNEHEDHSNAPGHIFARPRRSYHSDSEAESDSEDSEHKSKTMPRNIIQNQKGLRKSATEKKKRSTFHFGSSASDSESDCEKELFPRTSRKPSLFKDFLHMPHKTRKPSLSSQDSHSDDNTANSSRSESDNEPESPTIALPKSHHSESYNNLFKGLILGHKQKKAQNVSFPSPASTAVSSTDNLENSCITRSLSETSLAEKYGRKESIIGKGGQAVVRLCCPVNSTKKYAVKEFRKRRKEETQKEYVKKLIAEFCISSSLENINVVKTIDLIQDEKNQWCVVMEFCSGGDLYGRIHEGSLSDRNEVNCYFKQLVCGVQYLHSMGVAHKDLKPENLLLDNSQKILKISDFGVSEVFRTPFCTMSRKSKGCCGSGPYIAPEEFEKGEYDSESVDVWAIGIIYYIMVFGAFPWKCAKSSTDDRYKYYIDHYKKFGPIDRLPGPLRCLVYQILQPEASSRITVEGIQENSWFKSIQTCHDDQGNSIDCDHTHVGK